MSETLVEARQLSLRRGERSVLDEVDIKIEPGDFLVVLGPNGAGKSTLARALLGLERGSEGDVRRRERLKVGYVPQSVRRDPTLPLTTADFVRLGQGKPVAEASELLEALGAAPLLKRPVATLSGGEMRRAALARALLREPELLVLDEPFAGVDAPGQATIRGLLATVQKRSGCAIMLIAHEVLTVIGLAKRVLCLETRVLLSGTPASVVSSSVFERLFGQVIAHAAREELGALPLGQSQDHGHG